jgi:hypothetical protein
MEKEIKEKQLNKLLYGLDYIGNKIKNDDGKLELGVNNCKLLLDYITNLQERIVKAIKYIENHKLDFKQGTTTFGSERLSMEERKLLDILRGKDNENN